MRRADGSIDWDLILYPVTFVLGLLVAFWAATR